MGAVEIYITFPNTMVKNVNSFDLETASQMQLIAFTVWLPCYKAH